MTAPVAPPPTRNTATRTIRLSRAGVDLVLTRPENALPEVVYWGGTLTGDVAGALTASARGISPSALDQPWPLTLAPSEGDGWQGRPAFALHRSGRAVLPRWEYIAVDEAEHSVTVRAQSPGVALTILLRLDAAGVLWSSTEITNLASTPLDVGAVESVLPVGDTAGEVLDFSGRWTRERTPQRSVLNEGTRVRESRRGRTGHDSPLLTIAGEPGFSATGGQVWGVHLAWSADACYRIDSLPESRPVIGAGPLLRAGEITLDENESYRTPDAAFVWSADGLDGLGARLHASWRHSNAPLGPRPVTLNTWEAVYFHHDIERLRHLADLAASVGVERFVLDDGWFHGRRSDDAGLGDWSVDRQVWPTGLHPLVEHVRGLGMQFGLWLEPEMISVDSDLAREHPDWLLAPESGPGRTWRAQHVLDLARPDVEAYLLESISALVDEYHLDYIKWDHNRDLLEPVHAGRHGTVAQTIAAYRLLDELRSRFPRLEIESCASGGGRVDLGILARTDRVWASDTNDPIERLAIQRWTELLVPPELIGAHVGPVVSHTTHRHADLSLRIATALIGSMGIEWDITTCTPAELDELRDGVSAYRRLRPLLHSGRLAHPEQSEPGLAVTTVIAPDQDTALVRVVRVATDAHALPPMLRVDGLDPTRTYRVRPLPELRRPHTLDVSLPPWLVTGEIHLSGSVLAQVGVRPPMLSPGQALVLEITTEK